MGARVKAYILAHRALTFAWIVSILALIGTIGLWLFKKQIANDFSVYFRTANLPLIWTYWHGHKFPFPYMPTMLLWIAPLKGLPFWPSWIAWVSISIFALARACRPYLSRPELWLLFFSPPVSNGLLTGQVTVILVALMIWGCGAKNRWAAGLVFAVIASIKPQLVVMVPLLLLLRRDGRAIVAAALGFVLLVVLATLAFGVDTWRAWYVGLADLRFALMAMGIGGFSPAAAADGLGLNPVPFLVAGAVFGVWLVYRCRLCDPLATTAALGVGSIAAAPYSLTYDFAVAAPFLVLAIFRNQFLAALALSGAAPPVPLLLAAATILPRRDRESSAERREAIQEAV